MHIGHDLGILASALSGMYLKLVPYVGAASAAPGLCGPICPLHPDIMLAAPGAFHDLGSNGPLFEH